MSLPPEEGVGQLVRAAYLCDAREWGLEELQVDEGLLTLQMPGPMVMLRLLF